MDRTQTSTIQAVALVLVASCVGGCRKPSEVTQPTPVPDTAQSVSAASDHLAVNEIPEGPEDAFGLPVPRTMSVERRFSDSVAARGAVGLDALLTYVQRHVAGGTVELGANRLVVRGAALRGKAHARQLDFELLQEPTTVLLVVRDRTRPEPEPGLSEAERWRRAGIDPSGKITDPRQMQ